MGSLQEPKATKSPVLLETSCGYLLQELQMIWDEVGEDQIEREKVLVDIEQECLEVYRRKVDNANMSRARLHQELAEAQAGFTHLLLSLGVPLQRPDKMSGTLKEQLHSISPALKEMQMRKEERMKQFRAVQTQIQKVSDEIAGRSEYSDASPSVVVNESDLSLKKLEEYQNELQTLLKEKSDRLLKVEKYISTIQNLSTTLGMDSSMIITKVHPSLNALSGLSKNIGDVILAKLDSTVQSLEAQKQTRLEKLHQLIQALMNLWNLMDTPHEDRDRFSHVIRLASVPSTEISSPGTLTVDIIQQVEIEVNRLDQLKASKMKELFLKKHLELEVICHQSHMEILSRSEMESIMNQMNTGEIDHAALLDSMDKHIYQAQEESLSRKPIMEKVEKWILARDEERWLEEYNRDDNRYSVRRGAHKNLKRAEHARVMVNKIPALLDSLIAKTKEWEDERRKTFFYDGVPLLATLEEYSMLMMEKDVEKHRQREKKKIQDVSESGSLSGSRPSSSNRRLSDRSLNGSFGSSSPLNRRFSMGMGMGMGMGVGMGKQQQFEHESMSINSTPCIKEGRKARGQRTFTRNGFGSHPREDATTAVSGFSGPVSPYFDRVNY